MSNFEISVTPSPKLMRKIGATNLTVGESIAELVANSIDAGAKSIQIEVNHQKNSITVADDGAGGGVGGGVGGGGAAGAGCCSMGFKIRSIDLTTTITLLTLYHLCLLIG